MSDQGSWGEPPRDERPPDRPAYGQQGDPGRFAQPVYGSSAGYGSPDAYGQAAPSAPYGAPPSYGPQGAYGPPAAYGPPPLPADVSYASWGSRFAAYLVDVVALFACLIPGGIVVGVAGGLSGPDGEVTGAAAVGLGLGVVTFLCGLGAWFYNYCWTQGKRGQSWGKRVVGIHFVRDYDLQPPGGGVGIAKYALRSALGNVTCGLYSLVSGLWPLWDDRNQSLDDKILHTLVVRFPR